MPNRNHDRRYDDEEEYDRPRRRYRDDDDDDHPRRRRTSTATNGMATISLVLGVLSLVCFLLAGIPAIVCGFLGLSHAKVAKTGQGMAITGMVLGLVGSLLTIGAVWLGIKAYRGAERVVQKVQTEMETGDNRIKGVEVGLASHNYHDAQARFPNPYRNQPRPGAVQPKDQPVQRPLLSWRVDLLPFLNNPNDPPYQAFKLDESWDSATNRPMASRRVEAYAFNYDPPGLADTRWRGFTGLGSVFEPGTQVHLPGISDGTSNTLFCVESARAVGWTEPNDFPFTNILRRQNIGGPRHPLPPLGRPGANGFLMLMCDWSVKYVKKSIDPQTMARLIDRMDGNVIPGGWEAEAEPEW